MHLTRTQKNQGVALFCLFSTISTAFEHQYRITKKSIDIHGVACNITQANASERLSLLQLNYNGSVQQQQQQEAEGRTKQQDDTLHLPLQHYMPLPKSTTPHIDFEGSGQAAADEHTEHTEHTAHHWQARAVDSAIGAVVVSKKDNLDSGSGSSNVGGTESNAWKSKPDVILRRLKRTVEPNGAATTTGSTQAPLPLSLPTPLPIALTTTAPLLATHEWFALADATSAVTPNAAQAKGE